MEIKEIQGTSSNSRRFKEILEIQGAPGSLKVTIFMQIKRRVDPTGNGRQERRERAAFTTVAGVIT